MIALLCPPAGATEIAASASIVGTERLEVTDVDRARFPGLRAPALGISARAPVIRWEGDVSLGVIARLQGWRSPGVPLPPDAAIHFTLIEPHLGLDLCHARSQEGPDPYVRYGIALALPLLDPSTSGPQVALGGVLHLGVGYRLGQGGVRPLIELQGQLLPRTDGYVTTHHPATGLPTFIFFPGTASIRLRIGLTNG